MTLLGSTSLVLGWYTDHLEAIFVKTRDDKYGMKDIHFAEDAELAELAEDAELALLFTFLDFFPLLLIYWTSNTMNRSYTVNIKTKKGKVMKMVKVCILLSCCK